MDDLTWLLEGLNDDSLSVRRSRCVSPCFGMGARLTPAQRYRPLEQDVGIGLV